MSEFEAINKLGVDKEITEVKNRPLSLPGNKKIVSRTSPHWWKSRFKQWKCAWKKRKLFENVKEENPSSKPNSYITGHTEVTITVVKRGWTTF